MSGKAFQSKDQGAINEASRNGVGSTDPALEHRHLNRRRPMSRYGHYTDSARADNPENCDNWRSLGALRRRLMHDACIRGAELAEKRGDHAAAIYRRQMAEAWK